jgi:hypothetical protein
LCYHRNAGAIGQHVDPPERLDGPADELLHLRGIADVAFDGQHRHVAVLPNAGFLLPKLRHRPADEHDRRSFPRESSRNGASDAPAAARHYGHLVFQRIP